MVTNLSGALVLNLSDALVFDVTLDLGSATSKFTFGFSNKSGLNETPYSFVLRKCRCSVSGKNER